MTEKIEARRRWIEAGKVLAVDPKAAVACPACGQGILQVIDAGDAERTDRYMQCPVCRAYEIMTLRKPHP
jgi:formate dehydrogenase maturation protein FdhE